MPQAPSEHFTLSGQHCAVFALTPQGALLGQKVARICNGELFLAQSIPVGTSQASDEANPEEVVPAKRFTRLANALQDVFSHYSCHILICATGIAVRALAPLVQSKATDPAVLLLDQHGNFVISLLSGHLGGANALARELAVRLGATPVITTGTDVEGLPAIDEIAARKGLRIGNLQAVKAVSAAMLRGEKPLLYDPENACDLKADEAHCFQCVSELKQAVSPIQQGRVLIVVDWRPIPPELEFLLDNPNVLRLFPPVLHLGIGCKRGVQSQSIQDFLCETLAEHQLPLYAIGSMSSIDLKREEEGLIETATELGLPMTFYSARELGQVKTPTPSETVRAVTGSASVAEAAALLQAGRGGSLVLMKQKGPGITLAIALEGDDALC